MQSVPENVLLFSKHKKLKTIFLTFAGIFRERAGEFLRSKVKEQIIGLIHVLAVRSCHGAALASATTEFGLESLHTAGLIFY